MYIINRLSSRILNGSSPFELLFHCSPNYEKFHPFGCRVYTCLRDYASNKFSPRSSPCIFLGYSCSYKGFRCLDPSTSRIYIMRHAQFDETLFPFSGLPSSITQRDLEYFSFDEPEVVVSNSSSPPAEVVVSSPRSNSRSPPAVTSTTHNPLPCSLCLPASTSTSTSGVNNHPLDATTPEPPPTPQPPLSPPPVIQAPSGHPMRTLQRLEFLNHAILQM